MALAVMLSWALLVDALWNFLVDKPPHHDKVNSIEGELFGYKYDPYGPYEQRSWFPLNGTSDLCETLCEGQYRSILLFLTAVDVFGSTCTQFLNLENSEKNMASSSKMYAIEEVIDKIFESDEGEQLSEIDSEIDSEDEEACNTASLMFVDDGT